MRRELGTQPPEDVTQEMAGDVSLSSPHVSILEGGCLILRPGRLTGEDEAVC
jgi:hypothetical protein